MKKLAFLLFAFFVEHSFSLSLSQVRETLGESSIPRDSVEMNIRVSVKAAGVYRRTEIYMASKGAGKVFTEIKSDFLKQRSIINGGKMKIVDLRTNGVQVVDYNGEALGATSLADFHPLDSGEWSEPEHFSGDVYTIKGSAGTLYYDSRRKRVEKIEASKDGASSVTTFSYDALGGIRKMETSVTSGESGSVVTTEVLRMRKSDKVPDALFEF